MSQCENYGGGETMKRSKMLLNSRGSEGTTYGGPTRWEPNIEKEQNHNCVPTYRDDSSRSRFGEVSEIFQLTRFFFPWQRQTKWAVITRQAALSLLFWVLTWLKHCPNYFVADGPLLG
ncbi:hypothetical protein TNCT_606291 [Trichonephila clavata]|uniref:Uncharacterized protein n=1 Tax=Trichonephila clavata TaxID=2740835 RepID=A0A8X6FD43_TRICU|nr:hypothetical protein TNCT_606291 [Trichonephila clavata]